MGCAFKVLRLNRTDQATAPSLSVALEREMQAHQAGGGIHGGDKWINQRDRRRCPAMTRAAKCRW